MPVYCQVTTSAQICHVDSTLGDNHVCRADLVAWEVFPKQLKGKILLLRSIWEISDSLSLVTDSSGWDMEPFSAQHCSTEGGLPLGHQVRTQQFSFRAVPYSGNLHTFPDRLRKRRILFFTDNMALVHIINQRSSLELKIMVLVRYLVLTAMHYNIHFKARHMCLAKKNILADHLSHLQVHCLRQLAPWTQPLSTNLPQDTLPENACLA